MLSDHLICVLYVNCVCCKICMWLYACENAHHPFIHSSIHPSIHLSIYPSNYLSIYLYPWTCTHTHAHAHAHTHTRTRTRRTRARARTHTHAHMQHTQHASPSTSKSIHGGFPSLLFLPYLWLYVKRDGTAFIFIFLPKKVPFLPFIHPSIHPSIHPTHTLTHTHTLMLVK